MKNHQINIIEFPSNLGLLKKETENEPGVKKLPGWLKDQGLHQRINPGKVVSLIPPPYSMVLDEASGVRNADKIIRYAKEQAVILNNHLNQDSFQLILGGDCSILIGSALALKMKGTYGLFFIDGHTDFIGPALSQTGGAAGMDLAIVTGHGHAKLTNIDNLRPYFEEKNVFCVGNREYDALYVSPMLNSDITYFDLNNLRATGLEKTADQFLKMIEKNKLDGFFIHLDVDVLNDEIMPAVDSRQDDGINYEELSRLLVPLLSSPKVAGMEITILDPTLDQSGIYTKAFIKHLEPLLKNQFKK